MGMMQIVAHGVGGSVKRAPTVQRCMVRFKLAHILVGHGHNCNCLVFHEAVEIQNTDTGDVNDKRTLSANVPTGTK